LLYILTGPDDFSLNQSLEAIKKSLGNVETLATNTTVLDGHQVTVEQLATVCETIPFLAEKRLVIIRGLLERFEARGRTGQSPKTTRTGQSDTGKAFSACLGRIPDSTVVVLLEGNIGKDNPLYKELAAAKAEVRTFPLLKDAKLRQWIRNRVEGEGGSISFQAIELLTKLVGSNLWVMVSEINKLVAFTGGRRIEEEDVTSLVSYAQEVSVFAMIDAILEFKAEAAEQLLQQLLRRGAAPAYLLFMLDRQFRMIIRARELKNQRTPETEIQHKLGLFSEFALRQTLEQAGRYSLPRLKEVYRRLLETDLSIKTGRYDGELALNLLVAELCRQGKVHSEQSRVGV
jgi:DNA polymerase-3 subunit delta